jgi:membrane dipeptidase
VDDVLNTSLQPVIASHSNARALCDHPRNLTDAQMEAIAMRGGVIGVTFVDAFLNARNPSRAGLDDVIAHIEYMLARVGPDAVALGSDFDGCNTPSDIPDVTAYPRLTARLLERGHTPEVVRKVLGGNLLRVFSSVCGE